MACISLQTHSFFQANHASSIVFPACQTQLFQRYSALKTASQTPQNRLSMHNVWFHGCRKLRYQHLKTQIGSGRGRRSHNTEIRAMFTGIVEEIGKVRELRTVEEVGFELTIEANDVLVDVKMGDSIAVNGICLTVTEFDSHAFTVGLSPETLRKTSLGEVVPGYAVNLERALQPNSRMGGHFVQGHVDGTGEIVSMEAEGDSLWIKVRTDPSLLRYIVPKGFITVDGTSLTVVDVFDDDNCFNFMLVAYTQQKVVIAGKKVGNKLNLEVDILGKYVERLLSGYRNPVASTV